MAKARKDRLNVPGFSFGEKTDEYLDVPRIFGGHGATRKSGKPHSTQELLGGRNLTQERKLTLYKTRIARQQYNKGKRFRARQIKQPIKPGPLPYYCLRRYLEHSGIKTHNCSFAEPPELIQSRPKIVYEVTDGFLPLVCFTSAREAQILCKTYAKFGFATYFNQIETGITPSLNLKHG